MNDIGRGEGFLWNWMGCVSLSLIARFTFLGTALLEDLKHSTEVSFLTPEAENDSLRLPPRQRDGLLGITDGMLERLYLPLGSWGCGP